MVGLSSGFVWNTGNTRRLASVVILYPLRISMFILLYTGTTCITTEASVQGEATQQP